MIVFIISFIVTGCTYGDASEKREVTFTLVQIKDIFDKHEIPLTKQTEINPDAVFSRAYNEVMPEQFSYNTNQNISIYIYSSANELNKGQEHFKNSWAAADLASYSSFQVSNVWFVYVTETLLADDKIINVVAELKSLLPE